MRVHEYPYVSTAEYLECLRDERSDARGHALEDYCEAAALLLRIATPPPPIYERWYPGQVCVS
jgi:hypothetical protein